MNYKFKSRLGEQLYRLLPEVYRTRDQIKVNEMSDSGNGDLAKYLDANGHLLDLIHATLHQYLNDVLPGTCQTWLLPYFARLVAAKITSPDPKGQHSEMTHEISWRQRKGTLKCLEEIAEAVAQMEVEIQEGWRRVAITPNINMPIIPYKSFDTELIIDLNIPSSAIRHPQLPAMMIDLRRPSRSVQSSSSNPAARSSNFKGERKFWRQINHHGVPRFPGSYNDVSRRTVDIRTPELTKGHYHHKRLLVYAPPPPGFFQPDAKKILWADHNDSTNNHLIEVNEQDGVTVIRRISDRIIEIEDQVVLDTKHYRIEGINFLNGLHVPDGGKLDLITSEVRDFTIDTFSADKYVLTAKDCLFDNLTSAGLIKLERCTILGQASLLSLDVLDSILMIVAGKDITGVIAYSRIPEDAPISKDRNKLIIKSHSKDNCSLVCEIPDFIINDTNSSLSSRAVLSPNAPKSIYEGASDKGEMGYYHNGRLNHPVIIKDNNATIEFSINGTNSYPLKDIIFENELKITSGQLRLERSAISKLTLNSAPIVNNEPIPVLDAKECLFKELFILKGLSRLEYCTIMNKITSTQLQASDCIFAGEIADSTGNPEIPGCIRYSCLPPNFKGFYKTNTGENPQFLKFDVYKNSDGIWEHSQEHAEFGEYGYGVLSLATSKTIRFGAEDGGEMGAYHHKHYSLKAEAIIEKMKDFLPVGIEPVLIQDLRLLEEPPEIKKV